jgi:hypothetical protein
MMKQISLEELIILMMPFSKELIEWCKLHPEFQSALKVIYSERFVSLGAIVTSYSPNFPQDEVIGVYSYDYKRKNPIFKQDFIINKGKLNKEFVLYTRTKGKSSKYVKDINDFYASYGKGGFYINSHHLMLEQLPSELRERGISAIQLANKIVAGNYSKPNQKHINKIYNEIISVKRDAWYVKQKLKS